MPEIEMQLFTTLLPRHDQAVSDRIGERDVAVVIDVLRATSVMCTALQNGANSIITCREVQQVRALSSQHSPTPLLCGERGCKPISGFDLGNSPAEYTPDRVANQSLILTTTNGTRAIEYAERAGEVLAGSFLNLSAVGDRLAGHQSVHLVCAGTDGELTIEDVMFAGALVSLCEIRYNAQLGDDASVLAKQVWFSWFPSPACVDPLRLTECLRETRGGKNLLHAGYTDDLTCCARLDSVPRVPTRVVRAPATFQ
ncbi:MAG: 2-phosphosulfolactate phosphatase [Planctomycetota bacterium]|nr:2-phosphosulfolactate phosphatase [Planctomycetota bacterium]